jgi:hypothetical protein
MSDPVTDGRDALNHWFGYPWYDAKADGVRRVEVSKPWNLDWGWSFDLPSSTGALMQWLAWIAIALLLVGGTYMLIRAYLRRERRKAADDE